MAQSTLDLVKGILMLLVSVAYYWVIAIIKAILPVSMQAKDISGETVLITGAGSGIGRLMAIRFAKMRCQLVLWDINEAGNLETKAKCEQQGVKAFTYTVNLASREEIYAVADKVKQDVGRVDILVNNAGIVTGKKFLQCSDNMIQKTMEVNSMAHFWTVKSFLPGMMDRNHGHIVTIASSAGLVGVTGLADYCASKFAAVGFDESLRFELEYLRKDGIHTTVVCPFFINTGMFDGAKTRFPFLLPILDPDYAAQKITDAVLCNQAMLAMPRILYIFFAMKGLIPTKVLHKISEYICISQCMDDFKGRQLKSE